MRDRRETVRLTADLRERRPPFRIGRLSRRAWWTVGCVGVAALCGVRFGLDQAWPGAGVVLDLGLRWALGLAWLVIAAGSWAFREVLSMRWRLLLALTAAWFVGRAAWETYAALA